MVKITDSMKLEAEKVIRTEEKVYNYRTVQWEIQHICSMLNEESNFNEWDLFVPTYQREYVWSPELKVKFIESLFLNIPIPYVFINEDIENPDLEIIDWYQRIRTVYEFINNWFKLDKLDKLSQLNWFYFSDFSISRQKLFSRKVMNIVVFENLDMNQKKEMFGRINTTSDNLNYQEVRKWVIWWDFYDFIKELASVSKFKELCPLSEWKLKREEDTELVLRYFAYTEEFNDYNWNVSPFLTKYMIDKSNEIENWNKSEILDWMKKSFVDMLNFVNINFKYWFRKKWTDKIISSRVYFEAVSVWVWLALKEKSVSDLDTKIIQKLLKYNNFKDIVTSDWSNATKKFRARINSVKDALLYSKLPPKL